LLISGDFILQIWLHGRIAWNPHLAAMLAIWVVGQSFAVGAWAFLAGMSRTKSMAAITMIEGALVSFGALVLIRPFGTMGVAAAMVVAVLASAVFLVVAVRIVVKRLSLAVLAKSATLAVGSVGALFVLRIGRGGYTGLSSAAISLFTGSLLTILYAALIWYGVVTEDHRRRAQLVVKTIARNSQAWITDSVYTASGSENW
jgi:hypothetical protein